MKVSAIQARHGDDNKLAISEAAKNGAELIVLSELSQHPYFCQTPDGDYTHLAKSIPGPSTEKFSQLAKELSVILILSLYEKSKSDYFNTAVVIDKDGSIAGTYRKMHIPDGPNYYEKHYFKAGTQGFKPIDTSLGKLGVMICWDQWFPEAARSMALAGAEILIYPTAIGYELTDDKAEQERQRDAWITVQRGHGIANTLPVISCNRTGHEVDPSNKTQGINFWGSSFISGYQGEILALAPIDQPKIIYATIDKSRRKEVTDVWPYFKDRIPVQE